MTSSLRRSTRAILYFDLLSGQSCSVICPRSLLRSLQNHFRPFRSWKAEASHVLHSRCMPSRNSNIVPSMRSQNYSYNCTRIIQQAEWVDFLQPMKVAHDPKKCLVSTICAAITSMLVSSIAEEVPMPSAPPGNVGRALFGSDRDAWCASRPLRQNEGFYR